MLLHNASTCINPSCISERSGVSMITAINEHIAAISDLETIELNIAFHSHALQLLRKKKNTFALINTIPAELAAGIFRRCFVDFDPEERKSENARTIFNISHVCTHWRQIALNHADLWTDISSFPHHWATIMLERSQKAALKLSVIADPGKKNLSQERLSLFLDEIYRTKRLSIFELASNLVGKLAGRMSRPALLLRSLTIKCHHEVQEPSWLRTESQQPLLPNNIWLGQAPRLNELRLYGCRIRWNSPFLGQLTRLELCDIPPSARLTIAAAINMLDRAPNLRALKMSNSVQEDATSNSSSVSKDQISLPRLTQIYMISDVTLMFNLIQRISFPRTTTVKLGCTSTFPLSDAKNLLLHTTSRIHSDSKPIHAMHLSRRNPSAISMSFSLQDMPIASGVETLTIRWANSTANDLPGLVGSVPLGGIDHLTLENDEPLIIYPFVISCPLRTLVLNGVKAMESILEVCARQSTLYEGEDLRPAFPLLESIKIQNVSRVDIMLRLNHIKALLDIESRREASLRTLVFNKCPDVDQNFVETYLNIHDPGLVVSIS
jgi:hypothetical protein